jgi:hypothetical protein
MASKAQFRVPDDPFADARSTFDRIVGWLGGDDVPQTEADIERAISERGRELLRQLLQARFDLLHARECIELARTSVPEDVEVRARKRQLETDFGRTRLWRNGWKTADTPRARFPLDEHLNLPKKLYSYPLRERVADEARTGAWEQAVKRIDRTGAHVPKRQGEEQTVQAAQDFEAFYEQRAQPVNDTLSDQALMCGSTDSKGITVRPEALRDATRKAAEAERASEVRGDPMAPKKLRKHDKRMAIVTAVWEQEPHQRTAKDVIDNLQAGRAAKRRKKARKQRAPRPQNKRLNASVVKPLTEGVAEMFDEFDRRDPVRCRTAIVLLDGEEHQQTAVLDEQRRRERSLILVLDIIHVLSYLWGAGFALCRKNAVQTEAWVVRFLFKLLTCPVESVIADIQRSVAVRGLSAKARKPVDKCIKYFTRNASFMRYPQFLAQGLPIATGVIEGACRHLIQDRLGITGARWGLAGAEAVLKLRAIHSSGDWDAYWRFHEEQETRRNYAEAA